MNRFWRSSFLLFLLVLLGSTLVVWIWSYSRWETVYAETVYQGVPPEFHYTKYLVVLEANCGNADLFFTRDLTPPRGRWKLVHVARPGHESQEAEPKAKFALHGFGCRHTVQDGGFAGAESFDQYQIAWPIWFAAFLIVMPSLYLMRSMIRLRREHPYRNVTCANCGYDLRATPHRCPECGTTQRPQLTGLLGGKDASR